MVQKDKHKQLIIPEVLKIIPDPPQTLYATNDNLTELLNRPRIAIVGSRKMTAYGRVVTQKLATELASHGIVIVSGLAYGVDACAQQAALDAGGQAIAVLACGLDRIYPAANTRLAQQINQKGGVIVSEYREGTSPLKHQFLARNRLIAGLADAVLVTEAAERSGSLNTASHALNQGKPVLAVPGNIISPLSAGTNNLIKSGAIAVSEVSDILQSIGITEEKQKHSALAYNEEEYILIKILQRGITDGAELLRQSQLETTIFNQTLSMLEIRGSIRPLGNNKWTAD